MKYYRRWDPQNREFFVNEKGERVSEAEAKTNLVESSARPSRLRESRGAANSDPAQSRKRLSEAFRSLGLSKAESKHAAKPINHRRSK